MSSERRKRSCIVKRFNKIKCYSGVQTRRVYLHRKNDREKKDRETDKERERERETSEYGSPCLPRGCLAALLLAKNQVVSKFDISAGAKTFALSIER